MKYVDNPNATLNEIVALPYIKFIKWIRDNPNDMEPHIEIISGNVSMMVCGKGKFCDYYSYATTIKGMDFTKKIKYIGNCSEDTFPDNENNDVIKFQPLERLFREAVDDYGINIKKYFSSRFI